MSIDNATPDEWNNAAYLATFTTSNAAADLTPEDIEGLNRVLDRPFGEVPYVTRAYVFLLHQMGKVTVRNRAGGLPLGLVVWASDICYQVEKIEPPKTKPSIDWSQIKPEYKWLARDLTRDAFAYVNKPGRYTTSWHAREGARARADSLVSYAPGDCDWKDSLVERPAGV